MLVLRLYAIGGANGTRKGVKYIFLSFARTITSYRFWFIVSSPLRNRYERIARVVSDEVKSILGRLK